MTSRSIHILRPGLQTTVQDLGRWGHQALGVSVAGPMDPFSHRLANAMVGNAPGAATLEITITGPEIEFEDDCFVAIAGGEFGVTVDGVGVPHTQPFMVASRTRMHFGTRVRGARAYLAVHGGFDVPVVLGSRSTHVSTGTGGWRGRPLEKGDRLPIGVTFRRSLERVREHLRGDVARGIRLQPDWTPKTLSNPTEVGSHAEVGSHTPSVVRVFVGPDVDRFSDDAVDALQEEPYSIDAESDRMGFRLRGRQLRHVGGPDIISDGTPVGTVQVPGSGQPILLMADRQTTGGYPRIATVITADMGIAGQLAPGDRLSFRTCTEAEALSALIARERALLAVEATPP